MVKEEWLQLCYYVVTVVTAGIDQSEREAKKAGDSYSFVSSVHSHFHALVVFLHNRVWKKGGFMFFNFRRNLPALIARW